MEADIVDESRTRPVSGTCWCGTTVSTAPPSRGGFTITIDHGDERCSVSIADDDGRVLAAISTPTS